MINPCLGCLHIKREIKDEGEVLEILEFQDAVLGLVYKSGEEFNFHVVTGDNAGLCVPMPIARTKVGDYCIEPISLDKEVRNNHNKLDLDKIREAMVKRTSKYHVIRNDKKIVPITDENQIEYLDQSFHFGLNDYKVIDFNELEKYGKVLTNKYYFGSPAVGRDKEVNNLIVSLAQEKKHPLIVGDPGVGKTVLVEELAYRIQWDLVPDFLKDRIILEVNPSELVAGCTYVGQFEDKITSLMSLCEELDIILFIDEIHSMFGVGSTKNNNNDMASMLKHYIDRSTIKVIGTTTNMEYEKYFSNDALKRRFEKIELKEPTKEDLYIILDKVIDDYSEMSEIPFENSSIKESIINAIIEATSKKHRSYNDQVNNPDLSIAIIDKAFAYAKVFGNGFITEEHFIESIKSQERIYDTSKEKAIYSLQHIERDKPLNKALIIDLNSHRK